LGLTRIAMIASCLGQAQMTSKFSIGVYDTYFRQVSQLLLLNSAYVFLISMNSSCQYLYNSIESIVLRTLRNGKSIVSKNITHIVTYKIVGIKIITFESPKVL
jgi:hypothetical protein